MIDDEFLEEILTILNDAEDHLIEAEKSGQLYEHYDPIFRCLHNVKGTSGMLGLDDLQKHTHIIEDHFLLCKGKEFPNQLSDYFLRAVDCAKLLLEGESIDFEYDEDLVLGVKGDDTQEEISVKGGHIYVIDDEEDILRVLTLLLEKHSFRVSTFKNGFTMMEELKREKPDLIISDIKMPEIDGFELANKIKVSDPNIPFIFVSAHFTATQVANYLRQGVYGFLAKPIEEDKLITLCANGIKEYKLSNLLDESIKHLISHFSELENYLKDKGKSHLAEMIREDIYNLLSRKKELKHWKLGG